MKSVNRITIFFSSATLEQRLIGQKSETHAVEWPQVERIFRCCKVDTKRWAWPPVPTEKKSHVRATWRRQPPVNSVIEAQHLRRRRRKKKSGQEMTLIFLSAGTPLTGLRLFRQAEAAFGLFLGVEMLLTLNTAPTLTAFSMRPSGNGEPAFAGSIATMNGPFSKYQHVIG